MSPWLILTHLTGVFQLEYSDHCLGKMKPQVNKKVQVTMHPWRKADPDLCQELYKKSQDIRQISKEATKDNWVLSEGPRSSHWLEMGQLEHHKE